ncbi:hypothetical protein FBU59_003657 [Linderina macrospora]|uniref:Uncharacterized protein n=1 Tax=Linderina macrospora TaxID=4868 RepID=A0ACC1J7W9_9FUNG|nr:hypothetical protein FBU59_003657 [Linderina macrospora]
MPSMANHELVSSILAHRAIGDQTEYKVLWTSDNAQTWEPSANLTSCNDALAQYWATYIEDNPAKTYYRREVQEVSSAKPRPKPKPKLTLKRRTKAELAPEVDKIARIKGTQQRKALAGARTRTAQLAAQAPLLQASTSTKPPPATAKRSVSEEGSRKAPKQTARKSVGRRV